MYIVYNIIVFTVQQNRLTSLAEQRGIYCMYEHVTSDLNYLGSDIIIMYPYNNTRSELASLASLAHSLHLYLNT